MREPDHLATIPASECQSVRERVFMAALEGRCTMIPAGARSNETALILIDGEVVGQASVVAHYVREDLTQEGMFSEKTMLPERDWNLPYHLREDNRGRV